MEDKIEKVDIWKNRLETKLPLPTLQKILFCVVFITYPDCLVTESSSYDLKGAGLIPGENI